MLIKQLIQLKEATIMEASDSSVAKRWFEDNFEDHSLPLTTKKVDGISYFSTEVSDDNWETSKTVCIKVEGGDVTKIPTSKFKSVSESVGQGYGKIDLTESSQNTISLLLKLAKAAETPITRKEVEAAELVGDEIIAYGEDKNDGGYIVFTFHLDDDGKSGEFGGAPHSHHATKYQAEKSFASYVAKRKKKLGLKDEEQLTEAAQYETSADFEDAISEFNTAIKKAITILKSPEWKDWMRESESNYPSTHIHYPSVSKEALGLLEQADKKIDDLYDALVAASE